MSEVVKGTAAEAHTTPEPGLSGGPIEPRPEEPDGRSGTFDARVEDLRRLFFGGGGLIPGLENLIRRLGLAPMSPGASMLAGLLGSGIRLVVALLVTVLFGQWAAIPWGRWAFVLALYGAIEAIFAWMPPHPDVPPTPRFQRYMEDWTALLPTVARESDLRHLADFIRRLQRLPVTAAAGVAVAATMLLASWLFVPDALSELPAGSLVLLAWLLFDFGTTPIYWGVLINWAFIAREARYDHHLFWPSPADSPEVHKVMRKTTEQGRAAGLWITILLVMAVVLVGWDSPLVLPVAVGFIGIGYLATIGAALGWRANVRKIIERSRQQRLAVFRSRIDAFEPRMVDLSPEESEQLRDLLFLHDKIRDAPTSTTTAQTALRTAAGLLIPTIAFVITVFGEVSAERLLDALLP
jgi:hypothetical protein